MGIGEACARHLAEHHAAGIVLFDRDNTAERVAAEISAAHRHCTAVFVQGDCERPEDCVRVVQRTEALFGRLDGLVNAAGVTTRGTLMSTSVSDWDSVLNINLRAPFILTQHATVVMMKQRQGGAVVNISSVHAHGGGPEHLAYGASKCALNYITKHSSGELVQHGIRLNAVNVGWCLTPTEDTLQRNTTGDDWLKAAEASHPCHKLLRAEDVAVTVGFLLSDASSRVSGSCIDMHPELVPGCLPRCFGAPGELS